MTNISLGIETYLKKKEREHLKFIQSNKLEMTLRVPLNCGVTILGDFLKYLAINFRAKKAQIFGKFLGYLTFLGKNC